MITFELITELGRPIAALLPGGLTHDQLRTIYYMLPPDALNRPPLAKRWRFALVACTDEWARQQLKRIPCVPPKDAIRLAFL